MDFLTLKDISERHMTLINPISAEKLLRAGRIIGVRPGQRVIDFGCGVGELLALWGEAFGSGGVGIDVRPTACARAEARLVDRATIVCGKGADFPHDAGSFDVAACVGASFIWPSLAEALGALRRAARPGGHVLLGEPYWRHSLVPPDYGRAERVLTEIELVHAIRAAGLAVGYVMHASRDEWDRYESENWQGLLAWLAENPAHPERDAVAAFLNSSQDDYFRHAREFFGWALFVLHAV